MVGVPGRSKSCATCLKRHLACDLGHLKDAACGPCTKSRRTCRTRQSHIFVNHAEGTHKTAYRKTDRERGQCSDQAWSSGLTQQTPEAVAVGVSLNRAGSGALTPLLPAVETSALVQQQLLSNAQHALSSGSQDVADFPQFWSEAITSPSLAAPACKTSPALACYTAWLGRQNDDLWLVEASRKLYVQGLREVQQSVNDPAIALLDETLSACIGLIVYEALECPDRSYAAYHHHIDGCSALIMLRGVEAHRDGVGHKLFRGFRYIAVIKALQDHESTYLIESAWSQVPFATHSKDIHDRLLDVLALGASFLRESDRFATIPPNRILIPLLDMDGRLRELSSRLEVLYSELEMMHQGLLYWPARTPLHPVDDMNDKQTEDDKSFRAPINFADQETARLLTLYWAQQTLLRMGRAEIRIGLAGLAAAGMVQGHAERVNNALSEPFRPLIEPATLVLRARDYCSSSHSALLRYSVPLNITLDVLALKPQMYADEIRFAKEVKRQISQRHLRITQYTSTLRHVKAA